MRKALEELVFIGNVEDTFKMFGKEWRIQTLSSEEQLLASARTSNYDTLSRVNALKIEILTLALKQVDGIELNDPVETSEFVRKLQLPVINSLFNKYDELQKKQDDALKELDELKN